MLVIAIVLGGFVLVAIVAPKSFVSGINKLKKWVGSLLEEKPRKLMDLKEKRDHEIVVDIVYPILTKHSRILNSRGVGIPNSQQQCYYWLRKIGNCWVLRLPLLNSAQPPDKNSCNTIFNILANILFNPDNFRNLVLFDVIVIDSNLAFRFSFISQDEISKYQKYLDKKQNSVKKALTQPPDDVEFTDV